MDQNLEKFKDLQNRLQFTFMVMLFMPTFFASILDATHLRDIMLVWGMIIGVYIIIYAVLEMMKIHNVKMELRWLHATFSYFMLGGIISALPTLFIYMMNGVKNVPTVSSFLFIFKLSIYAMAAIPIITIILLEINYLLHKIGIPGLKYFFNHLKLPPKK